MRHQRNPDIVQRGPRGKKSLHAQKKLIDALVCQLQRCGSVQLIETHISYVLLTGEYAYKIKKPLNLGFLDFSTLDQRLHACRDEVRLNQRLAAAYYLGVVPITGTPGTPHVNGIGNAFEYAVKMRQFPPDATLDRLEAQGWLTAHGGRPASCFCG